MKTKARRCVYLLGNGPDGAFKIGSSRWPQFRCKVLSAAMGCELKVLASIASDDAFKLENYLHHAFAHCRVKREWFTLTEKEVRLFLRIRKRCEIDGLPNRIHRLHEENRKKRKLSPLAVVNSQLRSDIKTLAIWTGVRMHKLVEEILTPIVRERLRAEARRRLAEFDTPEPITRRLEAIDLGGEG